LPSVCKRAQTTSKNTRKTPEKHVFQKIGGSTHFLVDLPVFRRSAFFQSFAAFSARLHTLGKQRIFRAPQQSGPRNRGKMASEELRNSGGALRWSGSDAAARPPDNALQRRHGAPRRRAPKTLRRRVPGLDLALTCGSFSAMSLTAARATLQILKI